MRVGVLEAKIRIEESVCVVCVRERERERESVCMCFHVC